MFQCLWFCFTEQLSYCSKVCCLKQDSFNLWSIFLLKKKKVTCEQESTASPGHLRYIWNTQWILLGFRTDLDPMIRWTHYSKQHMFPVFIFALCDKSCNIWRESMQTREKKHANCTQKGPESAQGLNPQPFSYVATLLLCMQNMHRWIKSYWNTILLVQMTHLGGCSDGSISSQVETPLSEPHHGLITPIFGLCNVLIDLLQHRVTVGREEHSQQITGKSEDKKNKNISTWRSKPVYICETKLQEVMFLPSLCWTGLGEQTCGRARWSPLCMETGARSQRQSLAQSKMETWVMKQSYIISIENKKTLHELPTEKRN